MAQWDAVRNRSNWAASLLEKLVNEQRFLTRGSYYYNNIYCSRTETMCDSLYYKNYIWSIPTMYRCIKYIIRQCVLVVDNFRVKIRYTYTHIFSYVFKSCIDSVLSNCANEKKNTFGMRNIQYSLALTLHKQPSVFNTTYMIQIHVNCPNVFIVVMFMSKVVLFGIMISFQDNFRLIRWRIFCIIFMWISFFSF